MSHFLKRESYRKHLGTERWPIFVVVSSDDFETSIGDFWAFWADEVAAAANAPARRDTVGDIYRRTEQRYWMKNHGLYEHNQRARVRVAHDEHSPLPHGHERDVGEARGEPGVGAQPNVSRKEPRTFGTVSCSEGGGVGDTALWDILYSNDDDSLRADDKSQRRRDGGSESAVGEVCTRPHPTPSL
jgi:hypothetical protein